ncbi:MAG TPA: SdrD B-like domain-containing protein, partial [Ilumatobacteraceae bacterium]|nr:SdrD B-like domain-containing protein [Ilumatobacteraceae bacterium]
TARCLRRLANVRGQGGNDVAGTWLYTSAAPASIRQEPDAPSNNLISGATQWCAQADFGTAGCPASFAQVTGARFIQSGSMPGGTIITATVPLMANGNNPNDLYVGKFGVFTPTFDNDDPAVIDALLSNEPYVMIVGFSLGDLVWLDTNNNGTYQSGVDTPIANVPIEVLDSANTVVATATT